MTVREIHPVLEKLWFSVAMATPASSLELPWSRLVAGWGIVLWEQRTTGEGAGRLCSSSNSAGDQSLWASQTGMLHHRSQKSFPAGTFHGNYLSIYIDLCLYLLPHTASGILVPWQRDWTHAKGRCQVLTSDCQGIPPSMVIIWSQGTLDLFKGI